MPNWPYAQLAIAPYPAYTEAYPPSSRHHHVRLVIVPCVESSLDMRITSIIRTRMFPWPEVHSGRGYNFFKSERTYRADDKIVFRARPILGCNSYCSPRPSCSIGVSKPVIIEEGSYGQSCPSIIYYLRRGNTILLIQVCRLGV